MQLYHHMTIAGLERDLPICRITDDFYIAGFVIFGDPDLTVASASSLLKAIEGKFDYDYMITAEAKGIPLIHEMARQSGAKKYFLARKYPKAYMTGVLDVSVKSITTDKVQTLYLDVADAELMKGKKILVVDDVISTGESLHALEVLVEKAGGTITGRCCILAEGEAQDRNDLIYLEKLPVFNGKGEIIG